jgi:hypothetical protein
MTDPSPLTRAELIESDRLDAWLLQRLTPPIAQRGCMAAHAVSRRREWTAGAENVRSGYLPGLTELVAAHPPGLRHLNRDSKFSLDRGARRPIS